MDANAVKACHFCRVEHDEADTTPIGRVAEGARSCVPCFDANLPGHRRLKTLNEIAPVTVWLQGSSRAS